MKVLKDTESAQKTGEAAATETAVVFSPPAPKPLRAVLADGPAEMGFYGRTWTRGQPQPVTPEEWTAMQTRGAKQLGFNLTEEN